MITSILAIISKFILDLISKIEYGGIFLLMAIDSVNIPIPSEITMPFSGFLAGQGTFNFWIVVFAGTIGSVIGSLVSYGIAYFVGKPLINFLKKIPIVNRDYFKVERFFNNHGQKTIFWGRLIPVVRTFISFPAGIFKVNIWKFTLLTIIGSFIWSLALSFLGYILGENWMVLQKYFHRFDYLILAIILVFIVWYIWRKLSNKGNRFLPSQE